MSQDALDNIIGKYSFIDKVLIEIFGDLSSNQIKSLLVEFDIKVNFSDYGIGDKELKEI